jgi:hypothetical protein
MSLSINITNLATRVATECKALHAADGDLSALKTSTKTNLVAAINELQAGLAAASAGAAGINDSAPGTTSTYSSQKIDAQIAAAVAALVNGAPGALDTLAEIASAIAANEGGITGLTTAIGNRVSFADAQSLSDQQKARALANIGAAALVHIHAISDVSGLQEALDGKSDAGHTHTIANVSGLSAALSGKQAQDPTLDALAAVVTAANKLIYATGADTFSTTDLSVFARTLLDDVDQAAMRLTLGLGSAATQAIESFAPATHTHAIADVTGLQTALDAKANAADVGDTTTNFVAAFNAGLAS